MNQLNIFYEEPDPDRWFRYDRFPRKFIRRIIRGPEPIGGVKRWFVNLCAGLDKLGIPYSINDYKSLKKNPNEWAMVIGKPHVIEKIPDTNPIIYGPAIASHPLENNFWSTKTNIKHLLISSEWFKEMYDRDLPVKINTSIWPSGIDTDLWKPLPDKQRTHKFLIYDKIRWDRGEYQNTLIKKITERLESEKIEIEYLRYGSYKEENFWKILNDVDAMIFLCEHETQGFAYLQALSKDVPILAWDRRGYWQDPDFYPDKVKFRPVSSVPYWDETCGSKFKDADEFTVIFSDFVKKLRNNQFSPRSYVLKNLTLEKCALGYYEISQAIKYNT